MKFVFLIPDTEWPHWEVYRSKESQEEVGTTVRGNVPVEGNSGFPNDLQACNVVIPNRALSSRPK